MRKKAVFGVLVQYREADGYQPVRPALVVSTYGSQDPREWLASITDTYHAHLAVFGPSGVVIVTDVDCHAGDDPLAVIDAGTWSPMTRPLIVDHGDGPVPGVV